MIEAIIETYIMHMTASVSRRVDILYILFKIIVFFIISFSLGYMWGLALYSHKENIYMTGSFHKEGRFGSIKLV